MTNETRKELCDKAREFGRMVASTKIDGSFPHEMLALCSMCREIETFLNALEKGKAK